MANELSLILTKGYTAYAVLTKAGQYINGTAAESYNATHWTNYAIPCVDAHSLGQYFGDLPGINTLAAGIYQATYYLQAGASPATTDGPGVTDEEFYWTGYVKWGDAGIASILQKIPQAFQFTTSGTNHYVQADSILVAGASQSALDLGAAIGSLTPATPVDVEMQSIDVRMT